MFCLVCFDIVDDKVRYKAAKVLKGYGYRVQKSVFECPELTEKQYLKLKDRLENLIDATEDSVRYYRQCRACLGEFEFSGIGEAHSADEYGIL